MNDNDIQPLTLTVEQAAKLLGIGRSTAYELVHTGDIPSLRLGRRIVVPVGHIADRLGVSCGDVRAVAAVALDAEAESEEQQPLHSDPDSCPSTLF